MIQRVLKVGLIAASSILFVITAVLLSMLLFAQSLPEVQATSASEPLVFAAADESEESTESSTESPVETSGESERAESQTSQPAESSEAPPENEPAEPREQEDRGAPGDISVQRVSSPRCDGRGVLIIESVIDDGTGAAQARIDELLATHPGSTSYQPGACPSLRAAVDGQSIYPVVIDYGFNFDDLCGAFYAAGGDPSVRNARLLTNEPGAQSPC